MTRRDYIAIAEALANTKHITEYDVANRQWRKDREAIADVLAADNPRFDRQRFISACGDCQK